MREVEEKAFDAVSMPANLGLVKTYGRLYASNCKCSTRDCDPIVEVNEQLELVETYHSYLFSPIQLQPQRMSGSKVGVT